jgi:hypothetical protein
MRRPTHAELKNREAELQEDNNQARNDKLDSILDIASNDEEEEGEEQAGEDELD